MQDIRHQLSIARRWLPLIIAVTVVAGASAYLVAASQPNVYEATARLIVEPGPNPSVNDLMVAEELASQYARLAETRDFSAAVTAAAGVDMDADDFADFVEVSSDPGSTIIEVGVRAEDPAEAALLAASVADELVTRAEASTRDPARGLVDGYLETIRSEIDRVQAQLEALVADAPTGVPSPTGVVALENRLNALQSNFADLLPYSSAYERNRLVGFEEPLAPTSPVEPRPAFWAVLAAVAGFMLAAAVAFVVEYLRDSVDAAEDLQATVGLPALATLEELDGDVDLGEAARVVVIQQPASPGAEAYRNLRSSIEFVSGPVRTLLVAATAPATGKSAAAANLAAAYAETGRNVLLVDGDIYRPTQHAYFELSNERGLTTLLVYPNAAVSSVAQSTRQPRLRVLTAGPSSSVPGAGLAPSWIKDMVPRLLAEFDLVIFDSAELPTHTSATALGAFMQAAVLVVESGTRRSVVRRVTDLLQVGRVNVVGAILHRPVRGRSAGAARRGRWQRERAPRPETGVEVPTTTSSAPRPTFQGPYSLPGQEDSASGAARPSSKAAADSAS